MSKVESVFVGGGLSLWAFEPATRSSDKSYIDELERFAKRFDKFLKSHRKVMRIPRNINLSGILHPADGAHPLEDGAPVAWPVASVRKIIESSDNTTVALSVRLGIPKSKEYRIDIDDCTPGMHAVLSDIREKGWLRPTMTNVYRTTGRPDYNPDSN